MEPSVTGLSLSLDVSIEVAFITSALEARADASYTNGMRRTVPSQQPAHAVRVPEIRKIGLTWNREHTRVPAEEVLALCDALWSTGWREERCLAIQLAGARRDVLGQIEWPQIDRWSADVDNWEHVDHLSDVTGRMLVERPELLEDLRLFESSDNPWERRLALVTLIVAFRRDASWRTELESMAERLRQDKHPLVHKAGVWARDRLGKDHLDGR
jgi:3-methyladenine DNA glycosylase AlkD